MNGGTLTVVFQAAVDMVLGERGPERDFVSVTQNFDFVLADLLAVDLEGGG